MSPSQESVDEKLIQVLYKLAEEGVNHATRGLSEMVGTELTATKPEVSLVPILETPNLVGGPETEAIGVYLKAEGAMSGQFMLILPYEKALEMVDLLIFEPVGTTKDFGRLEKSALAEVGNLTGTFFLNQVATLTGLETKPSIPDVMVDMVGAILNIIVATTVEVADEVIMIRTNIMHGEREAQANFWFIPNQTAINALREKANQVKE